METEAMLLQVSAHALPEQGKRAWGSQLGLTLFVARTRLRGRGLSELVHLRRGGAGAVRVAGSGDVVIVWPR